MTQQPIWKCIGHIGDVDPIAYGGGFVYADETNVYGPELTYFEPASDEDWHQTEGKTPLQVYRIMLESGPREWWYGELEDVAQSTGLDVSVYLADVQSNDPMRLARLYEDLIRHFGAHEFDSYPVTLTEDEAYSKYAEEMKQR